MRGTWPIAMLGATLTAVHAWRAPTVPVPLPLPPPAATSRRRHGELRLLAEPPQPRNMLGGLLLRLKQLPSDAFETLPAGLKVVIRNPSLMQLSANALDDEVRMLMVELQQRLALSELELQQLIVACPSVLSESARGFDAELGPRLARLQERLGLSDAQLRSIVLAVPQCSAEGLRRRRIWRGWRRSTG